MSLLFTDTPPLAEPVDLDTFNDMSFQFKIRAATITEDIVSFLEHPMHQNKILAATEHQVIEINAQGICTVIAGIELVDCLHHPNVYTFNSISHILHVNMSRVRSGANGIEFALLISDMNEDCVRIIDLANPAQPNEVIGQCGTRSRMAANTRYQLPQLKMREPVFMSVMYFSDVIRVVISCAQSSGGAIYPLLVNFFDDSSFGYEYKYTATVGFVTTKNPFTPTLRSIEQPNAESCGMVYLGDPNAYNQYPCANGYRYFVPVLYLGRLLIANGGRVRHLIWSSGQPTFLELDIGNPYTSGSNPELNHVSVSSDGERLIAFSQSSKSFYSTGTFQPPPSVKRNKYSLVSEDHPCEGTIIGESRMAVIDACCYRCIREALCLAFSINSHSQLCVLYSDKLLSPVYLTGTDCYHSIA